MKDISIYIGKKFNYLTILSDQGVKGKNGNRERFVECQCDCGNKKIIRIFSVITNHTKSCGCFISRKKHKIGDRFGKLTLIGYAGRQKSNNRILGKFKCDCGRTKITPLGYIFYPKTDIEPSCSKGRCRLRTKDPWKSEFLNYKKSNAKRRGYCFKLTKKQFIHLCQQNCYYCGKEPNIKMRTHTIYLRRNGIDRIDSNKGYLLNNCIPCCAACNRLKTKLHKDEFLELIKRIYLYLNLGKAKISNVKNNR